jgi:hypothetical protein
MRAYDGRERRVPPPFHRVCRQAMRPLGRPCRRALVGGEIAGPEGYGCGARQAAESPQRPAWFVGSDHRACRAAARNRRGGNRAAAGCQGRQPANGRARRRSRHRRLRSGKPAAWP